MIAPSSLILIALLSTPAPVDLTVEAPPSDAPSTSESGVTTESVVVVSEAAPPSTATSSSASVGAVGPAPSGPAPGRQAVVEPLPAPPAPLRRDKISRGPWRGRFWLGVRGGLTGPISGDRPARPSAVAIGGGVDVGWRVNNWLGFGTGLSGQIHDAEYLRVETPIGDEVRLVYGNMVAWDVAFARLFAPLRRRFQPFAELGGGVASYERPAGGYLVGGQVRYGIGFDGWVSSNVTIGLSALGRTTRLNRRFEGGAVERPSASSYQVIAELGLHW